MKPSKSTNSICQNVQKVAIATANGYQLLDFETILYLESDNSYTIFYLSNNTKVVATKNLGYFEQKLLPSGFIRIHHSTIVNIRKIIQYTKGEGGQIIISNKKSLPVSRNRKKDILQIIKQLC